MKKRLDFTNLNLLGYTCVSDENGYGDMEKDFIPVYKEIQEETVVSVLKKKRAKVDHSVEDSEEESLW